MQLREYFDLGLGRQSALVKALGVYAPDVSRWADGSRPVPIEHCPKIEMFTNRLVTCEELRPDKSEYWATLRAMTSPELRSNPEPAELAP